MAVSGWGEFRAWVQARPPSDVCSHAEFSRVEIRSIRKQTDPLEPGESKPMRRPTCLLAAAVLALAGAAAAPAAALEECRLMRQPDIQGDRIVFAYAGDLWTVARAGGVAARLTAHEGLERFPKFSPDGKTIAFTAEYDGNFDAFTVPAEGGEPVRLTWHPAPDAVAEWYPDGKSLLLRSTRASAILRYDRFFKIPAQGGFAELLPLPTGGYATFSPDGGRVAFVSPSYDNRTWKHYKGGMAPEIWTYDFRDNTSAKITDWPGPDEWPMWHERTVYYCSDQDSRTANLWAWDTDKKTRRQVTSFKEFDVKWPSIGGGAIVFENGGYLYVMDLPGEKPVKIQVLVPDDKPGMRSEYRNVSQWIGDADLSPAAKRAVIEARGDIFTVPAEKGDVRNLSATPGVRERAPAWSPDGKWIAYFSDASGEFEVHVIGSDGKTPDRQVTRGAGTYRFEPRWSPDSKKIAFGDKTMTLWWCDIATGKLTKADHSDWGEIHDFAWSPDSRWLTYSKTQPNDLNSVMIYSLESGKTTTVSSPMHEDFNPSFDSDGKYLYFVSRRTFHPLYGNFEFDFQFRDTDGIYAVTLLDTLPSPVAPQSDEETGVSDSKEGDKKETEKKGKKGQESAKEEEKKEEEEKVPDVKIDLENIGGRVAELPVEPGRYGALSAGKGKLLFVAIEEPDPDADEPNNGTIHTFDLEKREDKVVISGVMAGYAASKDGSKLLYRTKDVFGIIDAAEGKKVGDGKIASGDLMATVDPKQEFEQMFAEAWRLERDFYYDPNMGGLDWKAVGARYRALVPYAAHRADLNYILGELIGELGTSHTYVGGGDAPQAPRTGIGLLGADYDFESGSNLYRFKTIYRQRDWNSKTPAPLGEPGVGVREGDYLLAVNGQPVRGPREVYAAFVGTVDKQTKITVGSSPEDKKPRTYTVKPVDNETSLRYTAWVQANRAKVDKATGGRIAYMHVPDTATRGIQEFAKQYFPQVDKEGVIVDERFNSGGFIPDFYVERLARRTWTYWSTRDGGDERTPGSAIDGPKCILINQYAGSGGDAFPYYFRLNKVGPLIGKRTWGGLVGIGHNVPLVDGGRVTMPDFGMWDLKGEWTVENHGVDPDIEVENTPSDMVAGNDAQLERAIQYCLEQLQANPPKRPRRPPYKVQAGLR